MNKNFSILFLQDYKRSDLLALKCSKDHKQYKIQIHRNHSFEMIASVLAPFLDFAEIQASFIYSDYDDSLGYAHKEESDLELIWLDISRYKQIDLVSFLAERIVALRKKSQSPILLLHTGEMDLSGLMALVPDFYLFSILETIACLKEKMFDLEKADFTGTRLSHKACLLLAKRIGLSYIPSLLKPTLKAIVLDLDNTLYQGVLAEDGIENLLLTPEHRILQEYLKNFKNRGFLLCLSSKNEESDVLEMFSRRDDFPLKLSDFSISEINWLPKEQNILKISQKLNIGLDSMLFIDDNIAEIQSVEMALGMKTILAKSPQEVVRILEYYPGLLKKTLSKEDQLRNSDIKANHIRQAMAKELSLVEYFQTLSIKLLFFVSSHDHLPRAVELLNKTNQFILNYRRYNPSQINRISMDSNFCIITISMSDSLSDSGIIAVVIAAVKNGRLFIDEIAISCRALGRKLESFMILNACKIAQKKLNTDNLVYFPYQKGDRNKPCLEWLGELTLQSIQEEKGCIEFKLPEKIDNPGVEWNESLV
ncbi:MAG: HAD-IIIC family phosphatase [Candidatus Brocadiae bacterium]|nr:HAD-IIIC family phosphatase [Candidatus Brocadiia bacterium]